MKKVSVFIVGNFMTLNALADNGVWSCLAECNGYGQYGGLPTLVKMVSSENTDPVAAFLNLREQCATISKPRWDSWALEPNTIASACVKK